MESASDVVTSPNAVGASTDSDVSYFVVKTNIHEYAVSESG